MLSHFLFVNILNIMILDSITVHVYIPIFVFQKSLLPKILTYYFTKYSLSFKLFNKIFEYLKNDLP